MNTQGKKTGVHVGSHCSDASVVGIVGLVVHDQPVVDEVEAVGLGLEWIIHHFVNWIGEREGGEGG